MFLRIINGKSIVPGRDYESRDASFVQSLTNLKALTLSYLGLNTVPNLSRLANVTRLYAFLPFTSKFISFRLNGILVYYVEIIFLGHYHGQNYHVHLRNCMLQIHLIGFVNLG